MWGLRSLIEFGPQLHATQEFLTEIYPFLANGTHGREFFTKLYPLLPNDILGWALRMGFLVIAVCAYYLTGNGLPTSTVTIQRDDDLFDVAVASLQKLEQPRSVLIAAKITSNWDSGSDSNSNSACSDSDDKSAIMKMEPNFGTHLYWYYWQPLWVQRGFLADSGGGNGYAQEFLSITTWSRSPRVMEKIVSRWFEEHRGKEATYTVIREADSNSFKPWSSKILKLSRPLKSILLPKEVKDEIIQDLEDFMRPSTRAESCIFIRFALFSRAAHTKLHVNIFFY